MYCVGTEIPRRCEWLKPALEPGIHSHRTEDVIQEWQSQPKAAHSVAWSSPSTGGNVPILVSACLFVTSHHRHWSHCLTLPALCPPMLSSSRADGLFKSALKYPKTSPSVWHILGFPGWPANFPLWNHLPQTRQPSWATRTSLVTCSALLRWLFPFPTQLPAKCGLVLK